MKGVISVPKRRIQLLNNHSFLVSTARLGITTLGNRMASRSAVQPTQMA